MRKTDILFNSVVYAVYMIVSCIVIMFAEILTVKIVNLFIDPSALTECVICALVYTVGVSALLAIVSYKEGYRAAHYSCTGTLISGAIASILHFLFALLFSFQAFIAGGVRFATALVKLGTHIRPSSLTDDIKITDMIPFFFIYSLIYIAVMTVFGKIGERNRLRDRRSLTGNDGSNEAQTL